MTMKKLAAGAVVASASAAAFAQESSTVTIDTTQAEAAVSAVGTALSGLISGSVTTNVLLIIGAGLVLTGLFLGLRYILKGGKKAVQG